MIVESMAITPRVAILRARRISSTFLPPAGGYRRLAGRSETWMHCLAYNPRELTARDRMVIHAVTIAHERPRAEGAAYRHP